VQVVDHQDDRRGAGHLHQDAAQEVAAAILLGPSGEQAVDGVAEDVEIDCGVVPGSGEGIGHLREEVDPGTVRPRGRSVGARGECESPVLSRATCELSCKARLSDTRCPPKQEKSALSRGGGEERLVQVAKFELAADERHVRVFPRRTRAVGDARRPRERGGEGTHVAAALVAHPLHSDRLSQSG
jgi:hypothetical protein